MEEEFVDMKDSGSFNIFTLTLLADSKTIAVSGNTPRGRKKCHFLESPFYE